jgi:hypothetical protein
MENRRAFDRFADPMLWNVDVRLMSKGGNPEFVKTTSWLGRRLAFIEMASC